MSLKLSFPRTFAIAALLGTAFLTAPNLRAATVDYTTLATGNIGTSLDLSGVKATSSGILYGDLGSGIGVVGGFSPAAVDSGESVNFSFDAGPQQNVVLSSRLNVCQFCATSTISFTGFGVGGVNLGTFALKDFPIFSFDISGLFSNAPLTAFTFTADSTSGNDISGISFTPATAATPEPSSLVLLGSGIVGVFQTVRRKRAA